MSADDYFEALLRKPVTQDYRAALVIAFNDWNNRKRVSEMDEAAPMTLDFWLKLEMPAAAAKRVLREVMAAESCPAPAPLSGANGANTGQS